MVIAACVRSKGPSSAYTGRSPTRERAINSKEDLSPSGYTWDAEPRASEVAVPGMSKSRKSYLCLEPSDSRHR